MFKFVKSFIDGVVEIYPDVYYDHRGAFIEEFRWEVFADNFREFFSHDIRQINVSYSSKDVLRGLHYQDGIHSQTKIVHVLQGSVVDVVVDLRPQSSTYKKHAAYMLSDINHHMLHIPIGCAHGFLSLENNTILMYFCNNEYNPIHDHGIRYDDHELNIDWKCRNPILSKKDLSLPLLKDVVTCNG